MDALDFSETFLSHTNFILALLAFIACNVFVISEYYWLCTAQICLEQYLEVLAWGSKSSCHSNFS
jgi:hypothetical protein